MQDTLPIHFAPLQGYTEAIYRNAHDAFFGGVDTYYTPFVRLEKGNFRRRDVRGIEPCSTTHSTVSEPLSCGDVHFIRISSVSLFSS